MSDWSSFQDDKKRMDDWREFLSEDKNKSDKEQLNEVSFLQSLGLQKMTPEEDKKIDKLAQSFIDNPEDVKHLLNPKTGRLTAPGHMAGPAVKMFQMMGVPYNDYNMSRLFDATVKTLSGTDLGYHQDQLIAAIKRASKQIKQKIQKEFDENPENFKSPDLGQLSQYEKEEAEEEAEETEEEETEEETEEEAEETEEETDEEEAGATPWYTRYAEKARGGAEKVRRGAEKFKDRFKGDEEETEEDPPEEYPASGFASLYKTLDDINKRLNKVADRDVLYDELEKLFKDQNFVVQEVKLTTEAQGEIEGGALILGRNPQFNLGDYPTLTKLVQAAAADAQLAKALKRAFVGAGFEGVGVSRAVAEPSSDSTSAAETDSWGPSPDDLDPTDTDGTDPSLGPMEIPDIVGGEPDEEWKAWGEENAKRYHAFLGLDPLPAPLKQKWDTWRRALPAIATKAWRAGFAVAESSTLNEHKIYQRWKLLSGIK